MSHRANKLLLILIQEIFITQENRKERAVDSLILQDLAFKKQNEQSATTIAILIKNGRYIKLQLLECPGINIFYYYLEVNVFEIFIRTFCMLGNFSCYCCHLLTFSKLTFSKNSFRHTFRVSNSFDPDQDRHSVGPDLGPNCLQMSSANDKTRH